MAVKDKVVGWFLRNVVIPGTEVIDKPGFIVCKVTEKKQTTYLRDLLFPERIFINLELQVTKKLGTRGHQALYSVGKKFGYVYSSLSKFPSVDGSSEKEILDFLYYYIRYMEATYANKIDYKPDMKNKICVMVMDDYLVCRESGIGHILSDGGSAGVWAFLLSDKTLEGVQTKCQGRNDKKCEIVVAPPKYFLSKKIKFLKETNLNKILYDKTYEQLNQIAPVSYAKYSLKDMIDTGFFKHSKGVLLHKNERYFLCDANMLYLLENELSKIKGANEILFDISFKFGSELIKNEKPKNIKDFIMSYMSAFGWGDVLVTEKNSKYLIIVNCCPWTPLIDNSKFLFFRGIISGMLSESLNKKIILDKINTDTSQGHLSVTVSQK